MKYFSVLVLLFMLCGCEEPNLQSDWQRGQFPTGATNIQDVGNGWITFEIDRGPAAGCYLYKTKMRGYKGYGFLTQIACG